MGSRRAALFSIAFVLASAAAVPAQVPEERPEGPEVRRAGQRPAEKEQKKVPSDFEMDASEVRIRAESQSGDAAHYEFRGFVDLVAGSVRIQADKLDFYTTDKPDGTKTRRIVGDGNVVFMKDEERLSGSHLDMDLDTGKGFFLDAIGYIEPGVFVEGQRIERLEEKVYRVEGGKFTSCAQPNPRWAISASSATIEVDEKIIARNALFKVKSVPALYFPILYYPIDRRAASTGFLIPHAGTSSYRGFNIGEGFFWAMSRSTDMTFYGDYYSKYGYGFGHEFRYALAPQSRGTFRTYLFWPMWRRGDPARSATTTSTGTRPRPSPARSGPASTCAATAASPSTSASTTASTTRARAASAASLNLQKSVGAHHLPAPGRQLRHLLRRGQLPGEPAAALVPGTAVSAEARPHRPRPRLRGARRAADPGQPGPGAGLLPLRRRPELSRPLQLSFLQLNPRVGLRYTRWSASTRRRARRFPFIGPALSTGRGRRRAWRCAGPPSRGCSTGRTAPTRTAVKHVIGPEVNFTWRTGSDDFLSIPKFDGNDYLLGTNQVSYSLVQRLLAKRPGPGGKLVPYEFFTWRVHQTYYVKIGNNQNSFDPNYSSSAFGPEGIPDHNSPISSPLRFRPTPPFAFDTNHEYDVNFNQLRTQGYALRAGRSASASRPPGRARTGSPRTRRSGSCSATPCGAPAASCSSRIA